MKNNYKNKALKFGMIATAASTFAAPMIPYNVFAAEVTPENGEPGNGAKDSLSTAQTKTNLTIHKLQHTEKIEKENWVKNTGHEMELSKFGTGVEAYNPQKYGDVGFTIYKVDNGSVATEGPKENMPSVEDLNKEGGIYSVVGEKDRLVGADGTLKISDLEDGLYYIAETKSPAGTVEAKAEVMKVFLPRTNDEGTGFMKDLHLYPKNQVKDLEFKLTKKDDDGNFLKNVKFQLYKGTPGDKKEKPQAIGSEMTTNEKGEIVVKTKEGTTLDVGDYFFVELPSDKVTADGTKEFLLGASAQNNADNVLRFSITKEGVKEETQSLEFTNYKKPEADKKLTDEKKDTVVEAGQVVPFTSTVKIPKDIAGGQAKAGGENKTTIPYFVFNYVDTLTKNLEFPDGEKPEELTVKIGETTLTEKTDYNLTIDKNAKKFTIDFITEKGDITDETYRGKVKVSDNIKNNAGQELTITYKLKIGPNAKASEDIVNKMDFNYNNMPGSDDKTITKETKENTLKAIVNKVGLGRFGIGEGQPLAGADFLLLKKTAEDNKVWLYEGKDEKGYPVWTETTLPVENYQKEGYAEELNKVYGTEYQRLLTADAKKDAAKKAVLTSDEKGVIDIEGLDNADYATYYVREVKAPENYDLYADVVTLNVDATPTATQVNNTLKPDMPLTGSEKMGIGIVLAIGLSGAYVILRKKETKANVQQ